MGASGNAILALYNMPGSGKKLNVTSIEIYNKDQLGKNTAADAANNDPNLTKIAYVTALSGGESVPIRKMNSSAADFPSTIQIKKNCGFTPEYVNWSGTTTYTDSTIAVGDITFTPSSSNFVSGELLLGNKYFIVDSGGNAGLYRITSNTATDFNVDRGFISATSTTGYIADIKSIVHQGILRGAGGTTMYMPISSSGIIDGNFIAGTGSIFNIGNSSNQQAIYVRAGEKLAVFADQINNSIPCILEATFIIEGTPNRTYHTSYYTFFSSENEAVFSIDNNTGSGKVLQLVNVSISEIGTGDTPYFQIVPFGGIDPASFNDSETQLSVYPTNSTYGSLSSSIAKLFSNVPVLPYGVPQSYIALGAPAAAVPRGFNYLNSKDFIGPVYMTFFPEYSIYKIRNTTYMTQGEIPTNVSHKLSTIKCTDAPIVVREGESIGIVSGAETATGTIVPTSGAYPYEFSITFSVENATSPELILTGLETGTEIRIFDHTTQTELAGEESVNDGTFNWQYEYSSGLAVDIVMVSLSYQIRRLDNILLNSTGVTIPIQQQQDRWFSNP